jgi:hypothetical protein
MSKLQEKSPALKREHQTFQIFLPFYLLGVIVSHLDADPDSDPADQNQCMEIHKPIANPDAAKPKPRESGSETLLVTRQTHSQETETT